MKRETCLRTGKTMSEHYYCIYWNDGGMSHVMRGHLEDLIPHVQRMDSEGIYVRLEAFGYEEAGTDEVTSND